MIFDDLSNLWSDYIEEEKQNNEIIFAKLVQQKFFETLMEVDTYIFFEESICQPIHKKIFMDPSLETMKDILLRLDKIYKKDTSTEHPFWLIVITSIQYIAKQKLFKDNLQELSKFSKETNTEDMLDIISYFSKMKV